jgi:hypothetical protein
LFYCAIPLCSTIDEPGCFKSGAQHVAWDVIREVRGWLKQASPSLRTLVTVDYGHAKNGGVESQIDIMVPLINDLWPKFIENGTRMCHPQNVGAAGIPPNLTRSKDLRSDYDKVPTLWTYLSCM